MEKKHLPQRIIGHLKTVYQHRSLVRSYCMQCGLYWQGWTHDLSKYSLCELIPSIRFYQGWRSPYAYEKQLYGYSSGWLHHKGVNKHHWEYWYDTIDGKWQPVAMPDRYVIESMCDRLAACRVYRKADYTPQDALLYFRHTQAPMHAETARILEHLLKMIAEQGEKETFQTIRRLRKKHLPLSTLLSSELKNQNGSSQ